MYFLKLGLDTMWLALLIASLMGDNILNMALQLAKEMKDTRVSVSLIHQHNLVNVGIFLRLEH